MDVAASVPQSNPLCQPIFHRAGAERAGRTEKPVPARRVELDQREPRHPHRVRGTLRRMNQATSTTPLQDDLIAMLQATRAAERDLFGMFDDDAVTRAATVGEWSPKDIQLHLAAWR